MVQSLKIIKLKDFMLYIESVTTFLLLELLNKMGYWRGKIELVDIARTMLIE